MEDLLNKLIEKGWKPFGGQYYNGFIIERDGDMCFRWKYPGTDGTHSYDYNFDYFKIRELVSKDSGLWQFVCENNLIQTEHCGIIDNGERAKNVFYKIDTYDEEGDVIQTGDMEGDKFIGIYEYEYRLIESALCNEEDLEKFLLDNIKVDVESN